MNEIIELGDISIQVTRKAIKHAHLSVHPPIGRVTLVAPTQTRLEVARAYAISKLGWIREQQSKLCAQAREAPRQVCRAGNALSFGASLSAYHSRQRR
jgi:predicted metal-dependent hydrolase